MVYSYHPSMAKTNQREYRNPQWRPNSGFKTNYSGRNKYMQKAAEISDEHWCETCDRNFNNADLLEKHKKQHEKCNIDGCQFVAHPNVITKHIQMQHSSGLYKKIANVNNPEEIKKWIEERKKKYPTLNNIEKKTAQIKEKIERGEKMGLQKNYKLHNNYKQPDTKRKHDYSYNNNSRHRQNLPQSFSKDQMGVQPVITSKHINKKITKDNLLSISNNERKLKPFKGIQDLTENSDTNEETEDSDSNFSVDDEVEYSNKNKDVTDDKQPIVCSALSTLMCSYESSDEETKTDLVKKESCVTRDNGKMLEKKKLEIEYAINKNNISVPNANNMIEDNNKSDCDSGPEEVKIDKSVNNIETDTNQTQSINNKTLPKRKMGAHETNYNKYNNKKPKLPSTLLQKLLSKEMQHERNVVLQCIRYVIKNDYFVN
ncbi:FMR1-interacting protein NUFIP1 [Achroia grisella]|uniref:FMR1-interacting protein NUFIP1 n=1 Tax=Achroia grisella TaxID=688607 RepID=UPI0027D28EB6|nr:FMR1-interacting protein NUFIP1 [Achroia grisella]